MPRRKKEWFDDDEFWQDVAPFLFTDRRLAEGSEQLDDILALAAPTGRAVLDLGCGPGRVAVPLAQRGFTVTGVDRTKYFLDKARARARHAGTTLEVVLADMRDFVRADAFDLALSLFTTFGYFDDKGDDKQVIENLHASLRPSGRVVVDVMGKETVARAFADTTSTQLPNGALLVERHAVVDDWTRVRNEWIVIRKGRAKNYTFHNTIYSGQELRGLLEGAGFVNVRLYGSFRGESYGRDAARLIAVAERRGLDRPPVPS